MDTFPIFMKLQGRRCMVVGGGEVAFRKVTMLIKAGADVVVLSPSLCDALTTLNSQKRVQHISSRVPDYLDGSWLDNIALVIAATDDQMVNAAVAEAAKQRNIPVNVVDAPELCTFIMPSIVDRSPVVIAVSSGGVAPVLARLIRAKIETMIPASYGRLANLAAEYRDRVKERFETTQQRRIFWEKVFQGPIAEQVMSGQEALAKHRLESALADTSGLTDHGEVYLVGGGPGDPDLLTFRALRLMQQADVCVYDKLVSKEVLELVRRDAELVYVGKERDRHTLPQEDINKL
ncbi:MAG TPA: NAD(P)-dependent oxidoreductase, partial [Methylophilaceae bacterium]|nr:NAD(P)-dependent oxidoreductase [Methylophilaceae bacterium]